MRANTRHIAWSFLQKRWVEIENVQMLCVLMSHASDFNETFQRRLLEKAFDQVDTMSSVDIFSLMTQLAKMKERSRPLLKAIAYRFKNMSMDMSFVPLVNLAYACARLRFCDEHMMAAVCKAAVQAESKRPMASVISLVNSLSFLLWLDVEALDCLVAIMLQDVDLVAPHSLYSLIITCGRLGHTPPAFSKHATRIQDRLLAWDEVTPKQTLQMAWSMASMGLLTPAVAGLVLSEDFVHVLQGEGI